MQQITSKKQLDAVAKQLKKQPKFNATWNFLSHFFDTNDLFIKSSNLPEFRNNKQLIYRNYLTNCVTAIEIYFKHIIIENSGYWQKDGVDKLFKDRKISLIEALNFRKGAQLKAEHLIVYSLSLKGIDAIQVVMSALVGKDFFEELEAFQISVKDDKKNKTTIKTIKDINKRWRADLVKLYELRNKYVHDDFTQKLSDEYIKSISPLMLLFAEVLTRYLGANFLKTNFSFHFAFPDKQPIERKNNIKRYDLSR